MLCKSIILSVFKILLWSTSIGHIEHAISFNPIDHRNSDVMPTTQLYALRLLDGAFLYEPMDFGMKTSPKMLPIINLINWNYEEVKIYRNADYQSDKGK